MKAFLLALLAASGSDYEQALQRELESLRAEKAALQASLQSVRRNAQTAKSALASEVDALAARLVTLRADNAERARQLPAAERLHRAEDEQRHLEQLKERIRLASPEAKGDLVEVFDTQLQRIRNEYGVRIETTPWFDSHGRRSETPVLNFGGLGAVSWTDAPKVLERTRGGDWMVAPDVEVGLVDHGTARSVTMVVAEAGEGSHRHRAGTLWDYMQAGGFAMWPLLFVALGALGLALERIWALARSQSDVRNFLRDGTSSRWWPHSSDVPSAAELESATETLRQDRLRGLSFLTLTAAVAPLLGLLGTVTGMIGTFASITEHGTGDPKLLSGGISEALITTQVGLMVAVAALLAQAVLRRWAMSQVQTVERHLSRRIIEAEQ